MRLTMRSTAWLLAAGLVFLAGCGGGGPSADPAGSSGGGGGSESAPPAEGTGAGAGAGSGAGADAGSGEAARLEPLPIRVGYTTTSATMLPVWLADTEGLFEKYGLDAEVSMIKPGAPAAGALLSGEMDVILAGVEYFITARAGGSDHIFIGGMVPILSGSLFSLPRYGKVEELRGKSIGVSNFGSTSHFSAKVALQHFGIDPDRDVKIVAAGGQPEALASLENELIDAALLYPPVTAKARELGMKELLKVAELKAPYLSGALATTETIVRERREQLDRLMNAMAEALHIARTDGGKSVAAMKKFLSIDDEAQLREAWEGYRDSFTTDMDIAPEQLQIVLDEAAKNKPEVAQTKPEDYYDRQFVDRLRASGLLERLNR